MSPEVIWLSNLNIAGLTPRSKLSSPDLQRDHGLSNTPDTLNLSSPPHPQSPDPANVGSSNRLGAHVRMAGDVFGEELAPDATIWKLYVEEAVAQDNELVNSQNKNLDMMLLFAALFSAILTAFLIEAKDMLQADPAEVSAALLLQIAQSQQRMESGESATNTTLIEVQPFVPTLAARWINGLWFTALALSLAAALVAMLAKEWLADYVATTVRPPYEYALQRQARYNGLVSWRALHITALLPSLLHLSLLFFALGIILLLWDLDQAIALVVILIVGLTALFYVSTAILGAIFESCPFVTQISKYVHRAWSTCLGDYFVLRNRLKSMKLLYHEGATDEVLQALGWLATNSRDRAVADCAYQALAAHTGINDAPLCADTTQASTSVHIFAKPEPTKFGKLMSESDKAANVQFLHDICRRISETLVQNHREVAACLGTNIARYAAALPKLVEHVESLAEERLIVGQIPKSSSFPLDWMPNQYDAVMLALGTLDTVWGSDCPALSADAYAVLTAAELRLAVVVASLGAPSNHGLARQTTLPRPAEIPGHTTITIPTASRTHASSSPARDGRAFARASVLLHYHTTGQIHISPASLVYLLDSISSAGDCEHLTTDMIVEFKVNVVGRSIERCPGAENLDDSNGVFRRVLVTWRSEQIPGTWTKFDAAAAQTIASFARAFLRQWIGRREIHGAQTRSRSSSYRGIDFELPITMQVEEDRAAFFNVLEYTARSQLPDTDKKSPEWALGRLLMISVIILTQLDRRPQGTQMLELVLWALYRSTEAFMRQRARQTYATLSRHAVLVRRLVELVADYLETLSPRHASGDLATAHLVSLLALSFERKTLMFYCGLPPPRLLSLLRIIAQTPNLPTEVQQLLADVVQMVQDRPKDYLQVFSGSDEGFRHLVSIGQHPEYIAAVASAIQTIIQHSRDITENPGIGPGNVTGFLEATSFVLSHLASDDGVVATGGFAENILLILRSALKRSPSVLPKHHSVFCQLLTYAESEISGRGDISLVNVRKLLGWDYSDLSDLGESLSSLFDTDRHWPSYDFI